MIRQILTLITSLLAISALAQIPQPTLDAANNGNPAAQCEVGMYYYSAKEYDKAVRWFEKSAKGGNVSAIYNLGICYEKGHGLKKDHVDAAIKYREAAERNLPQAQYMLAGCYRDGIGVQKNMNHAKEWYKRAADQNYPMAMYEYAVLFLDKNSNDYVQMLNNAFERGIVKAAFPLGVYYIEGPKKDELHGISLLKTAGENGEKDAILYLGKLYYFGVDVTQNYGKAFEYFSLMADTKNDEALYYLAECYEYGRGTTVNETKAYDIYNKIRLYEPAKRKLDVRAKKEQELREKERQIQEQERKRKEQEIKDYKKRMANQIINRFKYVYSHGKQKYKYTETDWKEYKCTGTGGFYILGSPVTVQEYEAIVNGVVNNSSDYKRMSYDEFRKFRDRLYDVTGRFFNLAGAQKIMDAVENSVIYRRDDFLDNPYRGVVRQLDGSRGRWRLYNVDEGVIILTR